MLDSVAGGDMVDELTYLYHIKNKHLHLQNLKKSKTTGPRFLVIGFSDEGVLRKPSPLPSDKGLRGLAGNLKSVTQSRNGTLLVEYAINNHSQNLLKSRLLDSNRN